MCTINQPFDVTVTEGAIGYTVRAVPCAPRNSRSSLCICDGDKVFHITKQQAMDFFGLKDPMAVRHNLD